MWCCFFMWCGILCVVGLCSRVVSRRLYFYDFVMMAVEVWVFFCIFRFLL